MIVWTEYKDLLLYYSAIVGTIALILNYKKYKFTIEKENIKLDIFCEKQKEYDDNIKFIKADNSDIEIYNKRSHYKLYKITVKNIGSIEAHIKQVGIITHQNKEIEALISSLQNSSLLYPSSKTEIQPIKAKSSKSFDIYLNTDIDKDIFSVKECFVIDKLEKRWNKSFKG